MINVTTSDLKKIKERYNTCFYCGEFIPRHLRTVDHIIPRMHGGTDNDENLVVCCKQCNWEKDSLELKEFIRLKLEGYDFNSRINKYKKPKEYGFEGAKYETKLVALSDLIFCPVSKPKRDNIDRRKEFYLSTKKFVKPTYVKKVGKKYKILNGFINYMICKELNINKLEVLIIKNKNPKYKEWYELMQSKK